jgi:GT2 family glycosyltransferase
MNRPPVTIAILAWNSWDTTRACLDSLRPTLGPRDQVVVVDNGSTDATADGLTAHRWIEVVTNPQNRGFAGGCNDGAARARHDVIIFLNNDTLLSHRWIDPLASAFEDPSVGAAGARSNFVSGPQVVAGANYTSPSEMRRFAREWAAANRGLKDDADRLVGFCLAVRRSAFDEMGGFDEGYGIGGFEDDDLCARLKQAGHRLVICHDSFVHHEGHKTFDANGLDWLAEQESNRARFLRSHASGEAGSRAPLVSACLIVRDEEETLTGCLESLQAVADEVVVYDTGSTDGTVDLGRRLGARVVEGYWDDNFSRARNAALELCRGDWIVWLDADETLETDDPAGLRSLLAHTRTEIDAWSVPIRNLTGAGVGSEFIHHATRVFRRARCEWAGRLHEQVARRGDHAPIHQAELETARIHHTGYLDRAMLSKDKAARNLRVAQAEVDHADGWERGYSLTSLARSLLLAGRFDEALAKATEALDCTDNPITRRLAVRTGVDTTKALGRWDEALAWCDRMRDEGTDARTVDIHEAAIRLALGQYERTLELIDHLTTEVTDDDGFGVTAGTLAAMRGRALAGLERYGDAADALIGGLQDEGVLDIHLGELVEYMRRGGRPLTALAGAIPAERTTLFLAQLLQLAPESADAALEGCVGGPIDQKAVLATASRLALRLPVERALVWSARLRQAGYESACPLIAGATAPGDPVIRARAAATAVRAFSDHRGRDAFLASYSESGPEQAQAIREETGLLCPELVDLLDTAGRAGTGLVVRRVGAGTGCP